MNFIDRISYHKSLSQVSIHLRRSINRAGRIAWDDGKKVLYLTYNKATKQLFGRIADSLKWQEFKKAA
jgi:hypothetical protein